MRKAFKKLTEDGLITKTQLQNEIEQVKIKMAEKKNKKGFFGGSSKSKNSKQQPARQGGFSFLCGA